MSSPVDLCFFRTPWGVKYNEQDILDTMKDRRIEMPDFFASILSPSEYVQCAASSVFASDVQSMTPDVLAHVIRRVVPQLDIRINMRGFLTEEQAKSIEAMVIGAIMARLNMADALIEAGDGPAASQILDDMLCECYYGFPVVRQKGPWTCYNASHFPPTLGTMIICMYDNVYSRIRESTIFDHFDSNLKNVMDRLLPVMGCDGFRIQIIEPLLAS